MAKKNADTKYDLGKLDWSLMDLSFINEVNEYKELLDKNLIVPGEDKMNDEKSEEFNDIKKYLYMLLDLHMYAMACAVVMQMHNVCWEDIVLIYTRGIDKYGRFDWQSVRPVDKYIAAALRHIKVGINKEDFGVSHWAHFCWNMLALRCFEKEGLVISFSKPVKEVTGR